MSDEVRFYYPLSAVKSLEDMRSQLASHSIPWEVELWTVERYAKGAGSSKYAAVVIPRGLAAEAWKTGVEALRKMFGTPIKVESPGLAKIQVRSIEEYDAVVKGLVELMTTSRSLPAQAIATDSSPDKQQASSHHASP